MFATAGSPGSWSCGHPVDAGDDLRRAARTLAVQDPDGDEVHLLGDAVRRTADRPGDVRAVAVAVVGAPAVDRVEPARRAAAELLVREPDPGVDHVGGHAAPGRRVRVRVVDAAASAGRCGPGPRSPASASGTGGPPRPAPRRRRAGRGCVRSACVRVISATNPSSAEVNTRCTLAPYARCMPGRDEPGCTGHRGSQHDDVAAGDRVAVEDQAAGSGGGRGGPPGEQARDQEQDGEGSEMATHRSDPLRS